MREGTFSYAASARCDQAEAARRLATLGQSDLHPLIVAVRELPPVPGAVHSYAITDRLVWGPLRFRIVYHADVLSATPDRVVTVARQWPRTTVNNDTRLHTTDGVLHVHVDITLRAPSPLFSYAFRQARAAHLALAARLPAALEAWNA